MGFPLAYARMADLAAALGVQRINELPGLWEADVDADWSIKVNGHEDRIGNVPPYSMLVIHAGMPVGVIDPGGGTMMGADDSCETDFIAAMDAAIAKVSLTEPGTNG